LAICSIGHRRSAGRSTTLHEGIYPRRKRSQHRPRTHSDNALDAADGDRCMPARGSDYRMGVYALIWRLSGTTLLACIAVQAFADRGALNPDVTQDTIAQIICMPGYTKSVRPATSFTNGVKALLLKREGLDPSTALDYELDHIIPLALGGHPRNMDNLELQPWDEARRKDRVEVKLQCLVCSGQVALADAQKEIVDDWRGAYHRYARVKCRRR